MKKFLTFLFAVIFVASAFAIPAKRGSFTVTNADGTTLTISLRGDETFHYYVTKDGTPVRQNVQGNWVKDERNISVLWQEASTRRNAHRFKLAQHMRRAMKAPRREGAAVDDENVTKKGLLILVNFSDVTFKNSSEKTHAIFSQMVNDIGNPYGKNKGSVREYFRAQSYNQFDIEFDVVGPVTVSKTMKYYGENDSEGHDKHPEEMILEAVKLADSEVNFADYDWDGDGEVENIYVVYAGYGEAVSGASSNTIWPHQWQLSETGNKYKADGVIINTYACGAELLGVSGSTIDGIGTMCHEYSHCLGLPDFYDTSGKGNVEMAEWSVLAEGCYNNNGFTPCGYTAYERWFSGWLEPTELKEPCDVTEMKPLEDEPEAYIVYNDQYPNEYYMLANHQKKGWDIYMKGHGMMILHVDYNRAAWYANVVNATANHPRMSLICADNVLKKVDVYYYADAGDLWPGTKKNTTLTDTSSPAASLFNANTDGKKFMHKPITDITEKGGLISFVFMGGSTPSIVAPTDLAIDAVATTGFTAQWSAVDDAVSYNLMLTEMYDDGQGLDIVDAVLLSEDFEKFNLSGTTSDGNQDLKSLLDNYTQSPGWSGEKVYQGIYGAKLGNPMTKGYLTTPVMSGISNIATVYINAIDWFNFVDFTAGNYKADDSTIDIILQDAEGHVLQMESVQAPDFLSFDRDDNPELLVRFTNVPGSYKICISTTAGKKRVYLQYLLVLDGTYTLDQIHMFLSEKKKDVKASLSTVHRTYSANSPKYILVSNPTTYTDIPTNYYIFTDLKPGAQYNYCVQAVDSDGNASEWSELLSVTLPEDLDLIIDVNPEDVSHESVFYDLSGRRHQGVQVRGIYIREGRKLFVR